MESWGLPILVVVLVVLALLGVGLLRLGGQLRELRASGSQPNQALLLLQQEIASVRGEGRQVQTETLSSMRQDLHQFVTLVGQQVGQMGSGVTQQLQNVTAVVGEVQGSLGKLGAVTQQVLDVGKDLAGLEQILRSPKVRGGLGETFLAELLGEMLPREQYVLQHAFQSGERVDAVIRLGDWLIPVDAKFPLENFRRMLEERDEERGKVARRAFVRDVRARVDEIATKYVLPDEGTLDFALMYIPAENVYYEVIVKDDKVEDEPVLTYALSRRVIPVSPNSFYAYLQTIALGLKGLRIERSAREIMALLGRLQGDLERFRDAFAVVGKHLTNARNKYDEAASALMRLEAKLEGIEGTKDQPGLPGISA
ncbi:MAG: DNA recombination protein RmuC [Candidatus Methylomirabilia bacterium]